MDKRKAATCLLCPLVGQTNLELPSIERRMSPSAARVHQKEEEENETESIFLLN